MRTRALLFIVTLLASFATACSKPSETASQKASPPPAATPSPAPTADAAGRPSDVLSTSAGDLRIVPIHHGSVLFELGGKAYYVDPFHEGNFDGLPKADVIFITHAHPDHLDPMEIEALEKPSTVIVCPPSVAEKLQGLDGGTKGMVVMKNGEKQTVGGIGVEGIAMYNEKRGPSAGKLFHEKGWGEGFVLTFGDKRVYLSGDTECTPEMRALKDIDVAFVCMNLPYTMPPSEAAECIAKFKPKIVYPYHYRGSDLGELDKGLAGTPGIEVRKRAWY